MRHDELLPIVSYEDDAVISDLAIDLSERFADQFADVVHKPMPSKAHQKPGCHGHIKALHPMK